MRLRLGSHGVDLVTVHGDTIGRYDVAKVGHGPLCEGTLGVFEPQLVLPERGEDGVDMLEVG